MDSSKIIRTRSSIRPELADTSLWPALDRAQLADADRPVYDRNVSAISDYFRGERVRVICSRHKIRRNELHRLRERCLSKAKDGCIWGFRACAPYARVKDYIRSKCIVEKGPGGGGYAGMLTLLFTEHPEIKDDLVSSFLGVKEPDRRSRESLTKLHDRFLKACRRAGILGSSYPFNTTDLAQRSVERFLKKLELERAEEAVKGRQSDDAQRRLQVSGSGKAKTREPLFPLGAVSCDGHRIDGHFGIWVKHPKGGSVLVPIERLWLLVIIDLFTRVILGYHIAFGRNYSAEDVFQCVRNSIVPWIAPKLTIPGLTFSSVGGMPSGIFPEMEWALWGEILLDNALANSAEDVRRTLTEAVGCEVNFGRVATPETRAIQERFFKSIAEAGPHRLPNTTGSRPDDPRRTDSVGNAVRFQITLEHLHDIAAVTLHNYNGMTHSSLGGDRSPLEQLAFCLHERQLRVVQMPEEKRPNLDFLEHRETRIVCGSLKLGKRPYINYERDRYTNDVLARSFHLLRKPVTLVVNRNNLQNVRAYLPTGESLGMLSAQGLWGKFPNSMFVRKAIGRLKSRRKLIISEQSDPVEALRAQWRQEATSSRMAATNLAKLNSLHPEKPQAGNTQPSVADRSDASDNSPISGGCREEPVPEPVRRGPRTVILL